MFRFIEKKRAAKAARAAELEARWNSLSVPATIYRVNQ